MPDSSGDHALSPETIELGRREVERLRARLRSPKPVAEPHVAETDAADSFGPDRMLAEMAAAGERDQLVTRVAQLEAEVAHLRAVLAAVIETAAGGVRPAADETERGSG